MLDTHLVELQNIYTETSRREMTYLNGEIGAPGEIRTPDQVVRSHLLYPAELRVRYGA